MIELWSLWGDIRTYASYWSSPSKQADAEDLPHGVKELRGVFARLLPSSFPHVPSRHHAELFCLRPRSSGVFCSCARARTDRQARTNSFQGLRSWRVILLTAFHSLFGIFFDRFVFIPLSLHIQISRIAHRMLSGLGRKFCCEAGLQSINRRLGVSWSNGRDCLVI
jgi:hypothetical protein